jgi:YHS domain-containing protein
MVRTLFIAIAAGSLLTFGLVQSRAASAAEHGHGMHHGDHHAMGEGHHGHDKAKATGAKNGFSKKPAIGTKAKCPVTGDEFTISKDTQFSEYKGKYYAFCCPGCKPQFDKNPEKYLK